MKVLLALITVLPLAAYAQLYTLPANEKTGWSSFENLNSVKGKGGSENKGAKGHAFDIVRPGEKKVLMNVSGAGILHRIWMTIDDRSPRMLRSLRIDMYWDGASTPAVSAPLGDFFGIGLGRTTPFQNALFSNPEGRSFNCNIPMPYRKSARVVLTNESSKQITLFYDINFTTVASHPAGTLYFHANWNRNHTTILGEDFEILPQIKGKGRFLGCNLGIIADSLYATSWWGEGEVKMYVDDDKELPTIVGTGTEDYIGTAWGQGAFVHWFQGCPVADEKARQWTFYRYHVPDPVYFHSGIKVIIQQMGGDNTMNVKKMAKAGARLIPVTVAMQDKFVKLFELPSIPKLEDDNFPNGWTNFYRLDNYSATAYFYLDKPVNGLPALANVEIRTEGLPLK